MGKDHCAAGSKGSDRGYTILSARLNQSGKECNATI